MNKSSCHAGVIGGLFICMHLSPLQVKKYMVIRTVVCIIWSVIGGDRCMSELCGQSLSVGCGGGIRTNNLGDPISAIYA